MEHSGIMIARIRQQLDRLAILKAKSTLTITTVPLDLPNLHLIPSLDQQVEYVAAAVNEMILAKITTHKKVMGNDIQRFN
jgi:hypothetical protein